MSAVLWVSRVVTGADVGDMVRQGVRGAAQLLAVHYAGAIGHNEVTVEAQLEPPQVDFCFTGDVEHVARLVRLLYEDGLCGFVVDVDSSDEEAAMKALLADVPVTIQAV